MQGRLKVEEQRRADAQDQLDRTMKALQITKEGLEHLAGKLNHIVVAGPTYEEGSPGPLGWTDWISLQSKGLSKVFSNTTVQKH